MPISKKLLKSLGVTPAALKAAFTSKKKSDLVDQVSKRISDRIREAIDSNLRDFQAYYAIDKALDTSFYQTSRTLFQGVLDGKFDEKTVLNMVKDWGFNHWLIDACGCGNNCQNVGLCTKPMQRVDIPAFFEITFPIALAFKNIRGARIYNDRNLYPQFKYEPMISTPEHRLKADIITHRVQVQSQQLEYKSVLKQVIHQTLSYSNCLLFPREAWWFDRQPTEDVTEDAKGKRKRKYVTTREGIRYEHPHPSRVYYDLAHPAYTLNSDSGCQYAGYWGLVRYGDIMDNPDYWNTDKVTFGKDSFRITETNRTFFATVMPCQMKFPTFSVGEGIMGRTNREERMQLYTRNERDYACLLTNHFEKLNPLKDLGLKNKDGEGYDGDVWFRFVLASDDTFIYAEPLTYSAVRYCGYDPDANKSRVPSLVMECIPAQDMIGNLITQAILQAKNNLLNLNFVNRDVIDAPVLDGLKNIGEKRYRTPQFVEFSLHESTMLDNDRREAIIPVPIQRMPIAECLTLINTVLDILARGLVMSAQELAGTASHELTAQEVMQTANSTSTRLNYTASGVDDFIFAWQRQLYDAGMSNWDDEIFAQVALQDDNDEATLEKLGFKIENTNLDERTAGVRGSKDNLELDAFTARRDSGDRVNNVALAGAMSQFFQGFVNNPMSIQIIGVQQFVQLVNGILDSFGFKKDWRLTAKADPFKEAKDMANQQASQSPQDVAGQLKQLLPELQKQIIGEVGAQLKPVFEQSGQVDAQQQQQIQQLGQGIGEIKMTLDKLMQAAVPSPPVPVQTVPVPGQVPVA